MEKVLVVIEGERPEAVDWRDLTLGKGDRVIV
jgi:hypothetical protein